MAGRLNNEEVKIAFFSKDNSDARPVSNETLSIIVNGIRSGIKRCIDRTKDVDMYCCLQGNCFIPNSRVITLQSTLGATMAASSDGNLRFKTHQGGYELHVIFSGGANSFKMAFDEPPPQAEAEHPPREEQPPPPVAAAAKPDKRHTDSKRRKNLRPVPEDSDQDDEQPTTTHHRRRNVKTRCNYSSDSSSEAEEILHFSQLTGRGRKTH
ncbi:expressed unknown protein [Seminavis robusta]|uniref:Uncharacterized protein n=1 Tax=Seminavis robusta TaxID=568900 RepID=A0A9N8EDK0_9STRA|nr:expressed unknown protein [Seminavis robusta]|eukprot:Sro967_g225830.1 n/a (210) ;mRNA; r:16592-17221